MKKTTLILMLLVLVTLLCGCQATPMPTPVTQKIIEQVVITATPMDTPPPAPTATPIIKTVVETVIQVETVIHTVVVTATPLPATPTPTAELVPALSLSGPKGEVTLSMAQLQALPATAGWGGTKSSTGRIASPAEFRGVTVAELCNLVGEFGADVAVNLVAKDGYALTYSYDQIASADFAAFDPETGQEIAPIDDYQIIVAYEMDGEPIPEDTHGPLRVVLVSQTKDQVSDGHWSIKWVRELEVVPAAVEWTLLLDGAITEEMDRATFESGSSPSCHAAEWTDEDGGVWSGIPLYYLMGRVDDDNPHESDAFDYNLARQGYEVQLVATDGHAVTLDSDPLARNRNILVANMLNDEPLPEEHFPLRLVGKGLDEGQMISSIAQIVLDVPPTEEASETASTESKELSEASPADEAEASPAVSMAPGILHVYGKVGEPIAFDMAELEQVGIIELDAEHPKKGTMTFNGVLLNELLATCGPTADATTIVCTASDGFSAEIALSDVQACVDCLVQIEDDTFGMVMPGMMTNTWVKDVLLIEVK